MVFEALTAQSLQNMGRREASLEHLTELRTLLDNRNPSILRSILSPTAATGRKRNAEPDSTADEIVESLTVSTDDLKLSDAPGGRDDGKSVTGRSEDHSLRRCDHTTIRLSFLSHKAHPPGDFSCQECADFDMHVSVLDYILLVLRSDLSGKVKEKFAADFEEHFKALKLKISAVDILLKAFPLATDFVDDGPVGMIMAVGMRIQLEKIAIDFKVRIVSDWLID